MRLQKLLTFFTLLLSACLESSPGYSPQGGVGAGGSSGSSPVHGDIDPSSLDRCEPQIRALAAEMQHGVQACSAVVRLDPNFHPLGYQLFCSGYQSVNEAQARAVAQTDTGIGNLGGMLNAQNPSDEYVFEYL